MRWGVVHFRGSRDSGGRCPIHLGSDIIDGGFRHRPIILVVVGRTGRASARAHGRHGRLELASVRGRERRVGGEHRRETR